jgi:hypothetical protein
MAFGTSRQGSNGYPLVVEPLFHSVIQPLSNGASLRDHPPRPRSGGRWVARLLGCSVPVLSHRAPESDAAGRRRLCARLLRTFCLAILRASAFLFSDSSIRFGLASRGPRPAGPAYSGARCGWLREETGAFGRRATAIRVLADLFRSRPAIGCTGLFESRLRKRVAFLTSPCSKPESFVKLI